MSAKTYEKRAVDLRSSRIWEQYVVNHCRFLVQFFVSLFVSPIATMAPRRCKSGQRPSGAETTTLLDLVEETLPLSGEDWDALCNTFNEKHPTPGRLGNGLRKKFATSWKKKVKTGDPSCPEEVRRAKRIKRNLCEQAEISDLEETAVTGDVDNTIHEENEESNRSIQHAYEDDSSSRGDGPPPAENNQASRQRNSSSPPPPNMAATQPTQAHCQRNGRRTD